MSHDRVKARFKREAAYGTEEEFTLYADHNHTVDVVTVYDEHGKFLFSYNDTIKDNLMNAINLLDSPFDVSGELKEGIEFWSEEDFKKIEA